MCHMVTVVGIQCCMAPHGSREVFNVRMVIVIVFTRTEHTTPPNRTPNPQQSIGLGAKSLGL
jgi:hypothetical protein